MIGTAIFAIGLGFIVLAFGNRLTLFAAGIGALLGLLILGFFPGAQDSWLWLLVPIGLAVLFAIGTGIAKSLVKLLTIVLGALAGAAIVQAFLNLFGLDFGILNWIFILAGALICAGLVQRFEQWVVIVLVALVGTLLVLRGLQLLVPSLQDTVIASIIGLVLVGGDIAYHGGLLGKKKSTISQ